MADYEFKYSPLTGRLTGKQMIEQTEQAINGLANLVDDAAGQVEIISTLANEANENAATALETAEEALATTGRTYITVSIPADANDYYDSQLIYIADSTSTNIPVADTGMLEVKTNDNKTACEQVFIADSSGEAYYRHGDITAETVGDVTTYTVTWGGWSSEPASQAYVQGELASYLPLSGGTMTGDVTLADGGKALSSAVVGKVVTKSVSSSVSLTASTAKTITSISLTAGTWVITGHCQYTTNTANRIYGVTIATSGNSYSYGSDGSVAVHSSLTGTIALQTSVILSLNSSGTAYLNGYATVAATVSSGDITAVRIV
jgi:hypothetical protein